MEIVLAPTAARRHSNRLAKISHGQYPICRQARTSKRQTPHPKYRSAFFPEDSQKKSSRCDLSRERRRSAGSIFEAQLSFGQSRQERRHSRQCGKAREKPPQKSFSIRFQPGTSENCKSFCKIHNQTSGCRIRSLTGLPVKQVNKPVRPVCNDSVHTMEDQSLHVPDAIDCPNPYRQALSFQR